MFLISSNNNKILKISFYISLLSILFSILFSAYYNSFVSFYYLTYFISIYFILYYLFTCQIKKEKLYLPILMLILYLTFVTLPITIVLSNFSNFLVFIKNNLLFIPLFLFIKKKFTNILFTINFIKTLLYGGIFFSFYLIFEFFNKFYSVFPVYNNLIFEYLSKSKNDYLAVFADTDNINIESAIRPLGLELNFTSGAFFLSSIFLILLFSGWRYIPNLLYRTLLQFILLCSILISSSRQNLSFLFLFIIIIFLQNITGSLNNKYKIHSIQLVRSLNFILIVILTLFFTLISNQHIYSDFLTGKSGGTTEILFDDFSTLFEKVYYFLIKFPFNFFFGIGAYTPENPGLYFELKPVNELHFLLDTFYSYGLFGFIIFWHIFYTSLKKISNFKSSNKYQLIHNFDDIKAAFFYIIILFISSNVHYSPIGLTSIYIISLSIIIPIQLRNENHI